jgi:hypothetical protein
MYGGPYDIILDVEQNQCVLCIFRKNPKENGQHALEYPMCYEVEGLIVEHEDVVEPLVCRPDGIVTCTKFRPGDPSGPVDPDQLVLGE